MPHRTKSKHGKGALRFPAPEGTIRKRGPRRGTIRGPRNPAPWLPNVAGTRFVRDGSKAGLQPKRIQR